jgi:nucleolar protein 58
MPPLYILSETSAGYAVFKSTDKKLLERSNLASLSESIDDTTNALKLKKFAKFGSASAALGEATAIGEGKATPLLQSLLDEVLEGKKAALAVADPKLANALKKLPQLHIQPVSDSSTDEVFRAVRQHLSLLIPDLLPKDIATMSLGLSHSLSRHKLRFSPDKVDTMIIQAISLLDDLDKELNQYAMRVKEWYGWHFPEMARIINDNLAYSRVILKTGMRSNASSTDLSEILTEDVESAVKAAAEVSMGTEITKDDLATITSLADQVVQLTDYRATLSSYLSSRMVAIAPNLTTLVGELVGARLIARAGSLTNLSKNAASTIQVLGAEKALFRALKTKHDTPKYGLIYHASLVGQATGKNKGKVARVLAAKAALGLRIDAMDTTTDVDGKEMTEEQRAYAGTRYREFVERKLRGWEGKPITGKAAIPPSGKLINPSTKFEIREARKYNPAADGVGSGTPAKSAKRAEPQAEAAAEESEEDEEMADASDDEDEDETVNGTPAKKSGLDAAALAKAEKKARKEERRARKAEKALRKAEKEARREAKRAKKEAKDVKKASRDKDDGDSKKRKADDELEKKSKKKKKQKEAAS